MSISINKQITAISPLYFTTTVFTAFSTLPVATINAGYASLTANAVAGVTNGAPYFHGYIIVHDETLDKLTVTLIYSEV
jgi:hypothetical protein